MHSAIAVSIAGVEGPFNMLHAPQTTRIDLWRAHPLVPVLKWHKVWGAILCRVFSSQRTDSSVLRLEHDRYVPMIGTVAHSLVCSGGQIE
eukprot:16175-Eustigmatos_ZCMA.PRE.1